MEVLLKTFDNEALAKLWAEVLEDQGIRSMVKPAAGTFPLPYVGPFIPHGLYVMAADLERGHAALEESGESASSADA